MNIRDEYKQHKKQTDEIITEAAMKWLDKNVVVISEKIDRKSVNKFVRSVEKFEELFGQYADKLPTIDRILAGAESNLSDVLTGRVSDKRMSDTMQYISYAYNTLSDFFSKDLPLLLRTKTFALAKENPEVRLDALSGAGFDINTAKKVFANAIVPSKDEMKLIGRIIKKNHIPNIDSKQISNELLSLTMQELENLTGIGKVPLVVTEQDVKKNSKLELLNEASNAEAIDNIAQSLNFAKTISNKFGLQKTSAALSKLYSEFLSKSKDVTKNRGTEVINSMDVFGVGEFGKITKQANQALETFIKLGDSYDKVKNALQDDQPTLEDINNIQSLIMNFMNRSDGVIGFFKNFTKAKPFPGLEQETILNELFTVAGLKEPEGRPESTDANVTQNNTPTQETPATTVDDVTKNKLQQLNKMLSELSQFSKQANSINTQATQGTPGTTGNKQADATQGTDSSSSTTGTGSSSAKLDGDTSEIAKQVLKAGNFGSNEKTIQQLQQVLQAVQKAGYKITK